MDIKQERGYVKVSLYIKEKVWKEFRKKAIDNGKSASKKVEKFMVDDLKKNL